MRLFIRTTLIGGVLFLIPLVFVVAVFGKAFQILMVLATPLSNLISVDTVVGIAVVEILTVAIMLVCCFSAGLIARSSVGRRAYQAIDAVLLQLIPGYSWVKGVTGDVSDDETESILKPVLVRFDDQSQLGFEADRTAEGLVAVFVPDVPDTRAGALSFVTADRVKPVDTTFKGVTKLCKKLGHGSAAIPDG